jgi:hypothetical protein
VGTGAGTGAGAWRMGEECASGTGAVAARAQLWSSRGLSSSPLSMLRTLADSRSALALAATALALAATALAIETPLAVESVEHADPAGRTRGTGRSDLNADADATDARSG